MKIFCAGECGICDGSCDRYYEQEKIKTMQKKRIYIAGKVSGEEMADVTIKFGTSQKKLEAQGYEVINPLVVVSQSLADSEQLLKVNWAVAMRLCITAMMTADEVYMLNDYGLSKGALLEHRIALDLEMKIRYQ